MRRAACGGARQPTEHPQGEVQKRPLPASAARRNAYACCCTSGMTLSSLKTAYCVSTSSVSHLSARTVHRAPLPDPQPSRGARGSCRNARTCRLRPAAQLRWMTRWP